MILHSVTPPNMAYFHFTPLPPPPPSLHTTTHALLCHVCNRSLQILSLTVFKVYHFSRSTKKRRFAQSNEFKFLQFDYLRWHDRLKNDDIHQKYDAFRNITSKALEHLQKAFRNDFAEFASS